MDKLKIDKTSPKVKSTGEGRVKSKPKGVRRDKRDKRDKGKVKYAYMMDRDDFGHAEYKPLLLPCSSSENTSDEEISSDDGKSKTTIESKDGVSTKVNDKEISPEGSMKKVSTYIHPPIPKEDNEYYSLEEIHEIFNLSDTPYVSVGAPDSIDKISPDTTVNLPSDNLDYK